MKNMLLVALLLPSAAFAQDGAAVRRMKKYWAERKKATAKLKS